MDTLPLERVTPCVEFPNDNPALHHGAILRCEGIGQPPTYELSQVVMMALVEEPEEWDGFAGDEDASAGAGADAGVDAGAGVDVDAGVDAGASVCEVELVSAELDSPTVIPTESIAVVSVDHRFVVAPLTVAEPEEVAEPQELAEAPVSEEPSVLEAAPMLEEPLARMQEEPEPVMEASEASHATEIEEADDPEGDFEVVDDLAFAPAPDGIEAEEGAAVDAPTDDPFGVLVLALEKTAAALGGGDAEISCMRGLLGVTRLEGAGASERAVEALIAGGLVTQGSRGIGRSTAFAGQVVAWQGILRGESEDFGPCGHATLDEWAADMVARVLGSPTRADGIRRELRRRGVAAFGLVADAA
jgi:hypothetical protein